MLADGQYRLSRTAMNRLLASTAAIALCAFWTGAANAGWFDSDTPDPAPATSPAAATTAAPPVVAAPKTPDPASDESADMADMLKNLPSNLDGEIRRAQLLRAHGRS